MHQGSKQGNSEDTSCQDDVTSSTTRTLRSTDGLSNRRTIIHALELSPEKIAFLKERKSARQSLIKLLNEKGFGVSFDFERTEIQIAADTDRDTKKVVRIIDLNIVELDLEIGLQMMFESPLWKPQGENLPFQDDVMILRDTMRQRVKVVGMMQEVQNLHQTLTKTLDSGTSESGFVSRSETDKTNGANSSDGSDVLQTGQSAGALTVDADPEENKMMTSSFRCKVGALRDTLKTQASVVEGKHKCQVNCYPIPPSGVMTKESYLIMKNRYVKVDSQTVQKNNLLKVEDSVARQVFKFQADAIVNSSNKKLVFPATKSMSRDLLKTAGNGIQNELHKNYPEGIDFGGVAKSGPGAMVTCKTIYHGVLPAFFSDKSRKDACYKALVMVVLKVLIMASSDGLTSIAIPALGTGNQGYLIKAAVQLMFKACTYFFDCAASPIQKVFFVIYPKEGPSLKQLCLMENFSNQLHTVKVDGPTTAHEELRKDSSKVCETRLEIGKTFLQVSNGGIKAVCDVTEVALILWRQEHVDGIKDNPVVSCFDKSVQDKIHSNFVPRLNQKNTKFFVDNLSCPHTTFIHLYCKDDTDDVIARAIARGIKQVEGDVKTIAIPVPSDGSRTWQPHVAAEIIMKALYGLKSLHHIVRVIIQDTHHLEPFLTSALEKCTPQILPDVSHVFDTIFPLSETEMTVGDMAIDVTSESEENNEKAAEELKKGVGITLMYRIIEK